MVKFWSVLLYRTFFFGLAFSFQKGGCCIGSVLGRRLPSVASTHIWRQVKASCCHPTQSSVGRTPSALQRAAVAAVAKRRLNCYPLPCTILAAAINCLFLAHILSFRSWPKIHAPWPANSQTLEFAVKCLKDIWQTVSQCGSIIFQPEAEQVPPPFVPLLRW